MDITKLSNKNCKDGPLPRGKNSQLAGEIRDYIDANNDFSSDFPVAASLLSRSEELLTGMER